MKYVIKFLTFVVLAIAVVYTYFINGNVSQYGFGYWTLAIVVSMLTIGNIVILMTALNYSAYNKNEINGEKAYLIVSSFLSFLVYSGIFFFTVYQDCTDWTYLVCCFFVYLISCGFNSRTWSFAFLGLTQYIFFCEDFFVMNTWHSWGIYVLLMIMHITNIIFVIRDRMDNEYVPPIQLVGLLIPVIIFTYAICVNGDILQVESSTLLILCCLIFSLLSSLRDSTIVFVGISIGTIIYLMVTPCSITPYLLVLIGVSNLLAGILHTLNKSMLISLLRNTLDKNNILTYKYNGLLSEYNDLVSEYNGLASQYVQSRDGLRGRGSNNPFWDGTLRGAGAAAMNGAIEIIKLLAGS